METIFLAQIVGLFSLIMGVAMFLRKRMLMDIFTTLSHDRPLLYAIGAVEVFLGLFLILRHNIWAAGALPIFMFVLGCLFLIEGITYLLISKKTVERSFRLLHNNVVYFTIALGYLAVGAFLVYSGF